MPFGPVPFNCPPFSHAGFDLNHVGHGEVDRPNTDPKKALEMAEAVFNKLVAYYEKKTGTKCSAKFADIKGTLFRRFIAAENEDQAVAAWAQLVKEQLGTTLRFGRADDKSPLAPAFLKAAGKVNNPK